MSTNKKPENKPAINEEIRKPDLTDSEGPTPIQVYYLDSLERLIQLKNSYHEDPGREEWLIKALNNAAYSAYRSCLKHGAEDEAKALVTSGQ